MKRKNKAPSKLAASGRAQDESSFRTRHSRGAQLKDSGVGREGPRYSIRDMTGGAWCFSTNWSVFERIGHRFA